MTEILRTIVLTGFMGTGKSTVGKRVADQLGRPFEQLADHFGMPIREVFAEMGEEPFRVAEAQLCQRLAVEHGLVISTGGGALINDDSRNAFLATSTVICLTASEEAILDRLDGAADRPLLQGERAERGGHLRQLLAQRRYHYGLIPYQIDTTGRTPDAVAAQVRLAASADGEMRGMLRIPVQSPENRYDLLIGSGLLAQAGALLTARGVAPGTAAIVTNAMLHESATALADALRRAGFAPVLCTVPEGEQHKTLATVATLYEQFLAAGLDRKSVVIALGGGVIGDMAGFAAATYLRGVPFVQMPTSLLAMVDASVGGKTGVDMPAGKNLVGAFKQPHAVLMDVDLLATLPSAEFQAGLGEVVKHGIIGAPRLFQQLEEAGPANLQQLVADAVRVKVAVVEEDPFEQGRRAHLNLGHTFGHAIELESRFTMRHGEAVAVGLAAAAHMAAATGVCAPAVSKRIVALLERLGLPTFVRGYDAEAVYNAMGHDKKRAGRTLRFVLPRTVGDVVTMDNPGDSFVMDALNAVIRS
jgi:3-dehydroquinate synthase